MKLLMLSLILLSLPMAAPVLASPGLVVTLKSALDGAIDRRSHHCNTAAQRVTARCRGV